MKTIPLIPHNSIVRVALFLCIASALFGVFFNTASAASLEARLVVPAVNSSIGVGQNELQFSITTKDAMGDAIVSVIANTRPDKILVLNYSKTISLKNSNTYALPIFIANDTPSGTYTLQLQITSVANPSASVTVPATINVKATTPTAKPQIWFEGAKFNSNYPNIPATLRQNKGQLTIYWSNAPQGFKVALIKDGSNTNPAPSPIQTKRGSTNVIGYIPASGLKQLSSPSMWNGATLDMTGSGSVNTFNVYAWDEYFGQIHYTNPNKNIFKLALLDAQDNQVAESQPFRIIDQYQIEITTPKNQSYELSNTSYLFNWEGQSSNDYLIGWYVYKKEFNNRDMKLCPYSLSQYAVAKPNGNPKGNSITFEFYEGQNGWQLPNQSYAPITPGDYVLLITGNYKNPNGEWVSQDESDDCRAEFNYDMLPITITKKSSSGQIAQQINSMLGLPNTNVGQSNNQNSVYHKQQSAMASIYNAVMPLSYIANGYTIKTAGYTSAEPKNTYYTPSTYNAGGYSITPTQYSQNYTNSSNGYTIIKR